MVSGDAVSHCNAFDMGMILEDVTYAYVSPDISLVTASNGCKMEMVSLISEFLSFGMNKSFLSRRSRYNVVLIASCCSR